MTMPSQTTSPPLTVTVLAALWVSLGRCGVSESLGPPGCDNGKLFLDRDLPADAVYWDCPGSTTWPESQRRPSIDTVYDPVPARQICMDTSISYNHTIPNSGAYRPVRAECGEYLYCPPQRWLNNLHHGAPVLLYHPCAPLHERLLLSVLARSCLPDYIITSHPQLNEHMPIALVSWGHTLELSTVASSDVCDWLETTTNTTKQFGGVSQSRKYNLLLIWSAEQHRQQHAHPDEHGAKMKSLRRCCEQTISSLLNGATDKEQESNGKKERLRQMKEEGKRRQIRAAIREKQQNVKDENERQNTVTHQTTRTTNGRTGNFQNYNGTLGPSAGSLPGNRTLSDPSQSQSKIQNTNQSLKPTPTAPLESNMSDLRNPNPSAGLDVRADGVNSDHNDTARAEARVLGSKDEVIDSAKQRDNESVRHSLKEKISKDKIFDKGNTADGTMKDNEVVNVKERELERKQTHGDTRSQHKSEKIGFGSVSKSQSESQPQPQPQQHQNPQPATSLPNGHDCGSCKGAEHCECNGASGASAALVNKGLLRTPMTDEGAWAAAALGFLLILLTLSVLHTRLYRHWRTTPSLYWHDPRQDYDSVADVIRRRLRIANRRRKRGRRQECVLLPSSSSSEEHL
ncbi:tumor protein p53-inducible protein 13 isoform X2 [Sander lucioperca]|uniref:tumor protein p53-inducible protein 13 isoform X2 n=1 Tax=Sander lucioperca TaxID=283035 RepID=UPI00125DE6D9|nr:tumor protein p53-inducible protein 13 isoform X2 [Sander lucioperca]